MLDAIDRPRISNIDFLWLELTNTCNLQCVHCYAASGPYEGGTDRLSLGDYLELLEVAHAHGCRDVQFIGGEATLHKGLPDLIAHARGIGYRFVEVFTNLFSVPTRYVDLFKFNNVHVATSVYSHLSEVHDEITKRPGSWLRTTRTLRTLIEAGVSCRAAVIAMGENAETVEETVAFLKGMGVDDIKVDRLRPFGRGSDSSEGQVMSALCGVCAGKVICVGADGTVAPCIMSKRWAIGNMLTTPFADLISGDALARTRLEIDVATRQGTTMCNPTCSPCTPQSQCPPTCDPSNSCGPKQHPNCTPQF